MIGDRLKELRDDANLTQPEFAAIAGTSKQYVGRLEQGKNLNPNAKFIERWAAHFGVRMEWITTGKGQKRAAPSASAEIEWSDVQGFAQAVGLGTGPEAQEYAETHRLKFRADSLARKRLNPARLAVMYGSGDSMQPRILPGDAILFDTSDTRPRDGHLFVILVPGVGAAGEYQVKRCEILDDIVYFRADNPEGDHDWRKPRRKDNKRHPITIIGRVRWIGSWEG